MNKQTYNHTLARLTTTNAEFDAAMHKYPYIEVQTYTVAQLINAVFTEGIDSNNIDNIDENVIGMY